MDGPHDLGGKEAFGPIDVQSPDFRHDWERRMWAVAQIDSFDGGGSIDGWRFTLELMPPAHYAAAPYFEKWCLQHLCIAVRDKDADVESIAAYAAPSSQVPESDGATNIPEDLVEMRVRTKDVSFARDTAGPPKFATGDSVRTLRSGHSGHTRLPGFARAACGEVIAHHGGHAFPDASAEGEERGEHLYTVRFRADALWPDGDARDHVCLDLWEPYLVRP